MIDGGASDAVVEEGSEVEVGNSTAGVSTTVDSTGLTVEGLGLEATDTGAAILSEAAEDEATEVIKPGDGGLGEGNATVLEEGTLAETVEDEASESGDVVVVGPSDDDGEVLGLAFFRMGGSAGVDVGVGAVELAGALEELGLVFLRGDGAADD